jgi:DNA-binding MarR family transcriptional regulator
MSSTTIDRSLSHLPAQARTLGFLLREVYGLLQAQVYGAVAAAGYAGLRAAHSPVLRHLAPEGGRVADLARATGLAKQSVTYVVEDLVALGYLRSAPDPDDGRARLLTYTPRGHRLLAALEGASQAAEAALGAALGLQRLSSLRDTLEAALQDRPADASPRRAAAGPRPAKTVVAARPRKASSTGPQG